MTALRQKAYSKAKLKIAWRRPKGLHSKLREGRRGHAKGLKIGFKQGETTRFKHFSGKDLVFVTNKEQLSGLDVEKCILIVNGHLGMKNKIVLLKEIMTKKFTVLNIKDPDAIIKRFNDKKEKAKKAKEKKIEKPKKVKKKKVVDEAPVKDREKKEQDKVLTQRQK